MLKNRWLRLIFGSVVLLFSGIIYAWSTIRKPFLEFGWTNTDLLLNYTITMCMFCIFGFISGLLSKKLSVRIRLIAAAVLAGCGLAVVSMAEANTIYLLYIGYGFMLGSGIGIVYNVVISATNAWFPDKKGISSGSLMMGFGLGSFIIGLVADKLFSIESFGWRKTYLFFGIIIGILLLVSAFIIKFPAEGTVFPEGKLKNSSASVMELETKQVVKRKSFIKLAVFFMLFCCVGSTAIADAKQMMTSAGLVDGVVVFALLVPVCNSLSRIFCGWFFDTFGMRKTQLLTSFIVIAATGITLIGFLVESYVIVVAGILLCGFSYGFSPTVSAALTAQFYGMKNFSLNFSLLNLILIPASFAPTLSGMLVTATESYIPTFIILTVISVFGLALNYTIKKP